MNLSVIDKIDRVHSYPAKFTVNFAMKIIEKYSKPKDTIYDPFLGSGTTLLAARILDRNGYGTDVNHIAILISKFKLLNLTKKETTNLKKFIKDFANNYNEELNKVTPFHFPSISHWFCEDSIRILSLIRLKIKEMEGQNEQIFSELIFSSIINLASNQESDTRYAAVAKKNLDVDYVANLFIKKFVTTLETFEKFLQENAHKNVLKAYLKNAKECSDVIPKNSVDLIFTSPPYPNTYDYYLYHKHRMNWLGYDVAFSMNEEIGSRREFSSLKKPKEKFDNDIYEILLQCDKALKLGGKVVLVMGDGKIDGKIYEAKTNMEAICNKIGWKLVDYSYSLLDETSKSFQQSYRTKGKKEHVLVFQKSKEITKK